MGASWRADNCGQWRVAQRERFHGLNEFIFGNGKVASLCGDSEDTITFSTYKQTDDISLLVAAWFIEELSSCLWRLWCYLLPWQQCLVVAVSGRLSSTSSSSPRFHQATSQHFSAAICGEVSLRRRLHGISPLMIKCLSVLMRALLPPVAPRSSPVSTLSSLVGESVFIFSGRSTIMFLMS